MFIASAVNNRAITSVCDNLITTPFPDCIYKFVDYFFRVLLAYLENFSVLCEKVEHRINLGI